MDTLEQKIEQIENLQDQLNKLIDDILLKHKDEGIAIYVNDVSFTERISDREYIGRQPNYLEIGFVKRNILGRFRNIIF